MYDVAVVGGGVAGASAAYHLAQRGASVVLYEREHLAAGSSGRSAAFIETLYADADRVRWTQFSARLYERLAVPFVQNGKLQLAHDDAQLARYARTLELREDDGARVVAPAEIAAPARGRSRRRGVRAARRLGRPAAPHRPAARGNRRPAS
jgi:sarcosine oxidase, subunit beta